MSTPVVVVTGGGRGIGAAIARAFARRGARLAVLDLDEDSARDSLAERLAEGAESGIHAGVDVRDREALAVVAARIERELGPASVVVNNAGIASWGGLGDPDAAEMFARTVDVNLLGTFHTTSAFLGQLRATRGSVVNLASVAAFTSGFTAAGYGASKGAIVSLTQKLARDLAPDGIRVNAVAPGYIATEINAGLGETMTEWIGWHCPMGRLGTADEVAQPVVFLASEGARFITGVTLPVDGGYLTV